MKRGSSLRRHVRLARVSAKVRRARPELDAVYRRVDERSGGRCEVSWRLVTTSWRCPARALDHHHCVKPRRSHTTPALVIHLCRRHHEQCAASYRVGRLLITPAGDGTFACQVVQKAGKWAPA